jgi:cobalt-precorrin-5B (C1)-methyltransferase
MIFKAVSEALSEHHSSSSVEVTIEMPDGEELAKKTLNSRLGILGGLSILGTTGIVTPVSAESWKATISSSLDVAKAMHRKEVVLSAGRTSEKAHIREYGFPEECYVMMGDYFEYSLKEAGGRGFDMIYVCAQWAKMLKIAMATPQTHVRHGAIDLERTVEILNLLGVRIPKNKKFNTAREIFDMISARADKADVLDKVQEAVKIYAKSIVSGNVHIKVSLVSYDGQILMGDR